jgi:serine/threonine protein kinase
MSDTTKDEFFRGEGSRGPDEQARGQHDPGATNAGSGVKTSPAPVRWVRGLIVAAAGAVGSVLSAGTLVWRRLTRRGVKGIPPTGGRAASVVAPTPNATDEQATPGGMRRTASDQIGKGGQGKVHWSLDKTLGRPVALKTPTEPTEAASRTFRREAVITAYLSRQGILQVYNFRERNESGLPEITTQYVEGEKTLGDSIREFHGPRSEAGSDVAVQAEKCRLLIDQLLVVCDVLAKAHRRGVIHCDIKPSNILVVERDREVFVIDWGIAHVEQDGELAKSADLSDTARSVLRGERPRRWTPGYGHPEMAPPKDGELRKNEKPRTAWDIYALGATLFTVLTNRTPPHDFAGTSVEQLLDNYLRGPKRRDLTNLLTPLAAISCKAMTTDPGSYQCVDELAEDLRTWGRGDVVTAFASCKTLREPFSIRSGRFAARRWKEMTAVSAVGLVSMIASVLTTSLYLDKSKAEAFAVKEKQVADHSVEFALAAAEDIFETLHDDALLHQDGAGPAVRAMNVRHLAFADQLIKERGDDPAIKGHLAHAHWRRGIILSKEDPREAASAFRRALELHRELEQKHEEVRESAAHRFRSAKIWFGLASVLEEQDGQWDEAAAAGAEGRKIVESLLAGEPKNTLYLTALANSLREQTLLQRQRPNAHDPGNVKDAIRLGEKAIELHEKALELDKENPKLVWYLARQHQAMGTLHQWAGNSDAALAEYKKALEGLTPIVRKHPSVTAYRLDLAMALQGTGELLGKKFAKERTREALGRLSDAAAHFERLYQHNPDQPDYEREYVASLLLMATLRGTDRPHDAIPDAKKAVDRFDALAARFPSKKQYRIDAIRGRIDVSTLQDRDQQYAAAGKTLQEAEDKALQLRAMNDNNSEAVRLLLDIYQTLAWVYHRESRAPSEVAAIVCKQRPLAAGNPPRLFEIACDLAQCVALAENRKNDLNAAELGKARDYASTAIDVLQEAVLKDEQLRARLGTERRLKVLVGHAKFQSLIGNRE